MLTSARRTTVPDAEHSEGGSLRHETAPYRGWVESDANDRFTWSANLRFLFRPAANQPG
jgi:hypothetical protein